MFRGGGKPVPDWRATKGAERRGEKKGESVWCASRGAGQPQALGSIKLQGQPIGPHFRLAGPGTAHKVEMGPVIGLRYRLGDWDGPTRVCGRRTSLCCTRSGPGRVDSSPCASPCASVIAKCQARGITPFWGGEGEFSRRQATKAAAWCR